MWYGAAAKIQGVNQITFWNAQLLKWFNMVNVWWTQQTCMWQQALMHVLFDKNSLNKWSFKVYEIIIIEYFVYFCLLWFEVYKLTSILYFKLTIAVLLIAEECTHRLYRELKIDKQAFSKAL